MLDQIMGYVFDFGWATEKDYVKGQHKDTSGIANPTGSVGTNRVFYMLACETLITTNEWVMSIYAGAKYMDTLGIECSKKPVLFSRYTMSRELLRKIKHLHLHVSCNIFPVDASESQSLPQSMSWLPDFLDNIGHLKSLSIDISDALAAIPNGSDLSLKLWEQLANTIGAGNVKIHSRIYVFSKLDNVVTILSSPDFDKNVRPT